MRPEPVTIHHLRCVCTVNSSQPHPLLAVYGRDENGDAYVHVRVYKAKRIYAEIYTTDPISIMCRICGRWWKINVINRKLTAQERAIPKPLVDKKPDPVVLLDNEN